MYAAKTWRPCFYKCSSEIVNFSMNDKYTSYRSSPLIDKYYSLSTSSLDLNRNPSGKTIIGRKESLHLKYYLAKSKEKGPASETNLDSKNGKEILDYPYLLS